MTAILESRLFKDKPSLEFQDISLTLALPDDVHETLSVKPGALACLPPDAGAAGRLCQTFQSSDSATAELL